MDGSAAFARWCQYAPTSNSWFLRHSGVHIPNDISIAPSVFAWLTIDKPTIRPTNHFRRPITTGRIYVVLRCGIKVTQTHAAICTCSVLHTCICCHSNEIRVPTANPPNSAPPTIPPRLHQGPCSSVGMRQGTDTVTHVTNIHLTSSTTHAKCL